MSLAANHRGSEITSFFKVNKNAHQFHITFIKKNILKFSFKPYQTDSFTIVYSIRVFCCIPLQCKEEESVRICNLEFSF